MVRPDHIYIPVGCVPAAHRPYGGVSFLGRSAWSRGGVCLVQGGSAWSGVGGLPGPGGVCLVVGGGVGVCSGGGLPGPGVGWWYPSMH